MADASPLVQDLIKALERIVDYPPRIHRKRYENRIDWGMRLKAHAEDQLWRRREIANAALKRAEQAGAVVTWPDKACAYCKCKGPNVSPSRLWKETLCDGCRFEQTGGREGASKEAKPC